MKKPKMNLFVTQLTTGVIVALALQTTARARPDTVETYDENGQNAAMVDMVYTNHSLGYVGFVTDIATAWNAGEGGVIDEFERNGDYSSFQGQDFAIGYGINSYYDPAAATGPTITLTVINNNWDLATNGYLAAPAISQDYYMLIGPRSQNQPITMATSSGSQVSQLAFTVLKENTGLITAVAHFSDGTDYTESFDPSQEGNTFFGAVAPSGEYIDYFSISSANKYVSIDDLAFTTLAPVPETSCISLAVVGLALAGRRRRSA
jgi:hypothetical protein